MSTKRNRYRVPFKAKVAVEATKVVKTTTQLASEYQIHPTLVNQWKRQTLENLAAVFGGGRTGVEADVEANTAPLYEQIGRLKLELAC